MIELNNNEMELIFGGGFSYSLINAITKAGTLLYNLGQSLGSTLKRIISGSYC